mgnify:CR=1 FL=1
MQDHNTTRPPWQTTGARRWRTWGLSGKLLAQYEAIRRQEYEQITDLLDTLGRVDGLPENEALAALRGLARYAIERKH